MITREDKAGAVVKRALFSDCEKYRYLLSREWDVKKHQIIFYWFKSSTADERIDDPTIRRCRGFAESWGYGKMYMLNLFAYRSTDPNPLKEYP